ncbi:MAG: hypothetical protein FWD62_12565 [Betaproteobacteria bacterium]|nr:hypothetical protein [Betaproteobacteria bacterium]
MLAFALGVFLPIFVSVPIAFAITIAQHKKRVARYENFAAENNVNANNKHIEKAQQNQE